MDKHKRKAARSSLSDRARYLFDQSMSAGTVALIGWLGALSLVIIILASIFLVTARIAPEGGEPRNLVEAMWESLMRTIDSGTLGGDEGWPYRVVMLVVTIAGIFVFSALIGVLSTGLESKIAELRKGRSRVLEEGHTIILNWSPTLVDIISELAVANIGRTRARIVILADRDKLEMEDEIATKAPKLRGMRVICRSGDPCDLNDLAIVNPGAAKSIIVMAPEGDDPDSQVIKSVLAITNAPDRRKAAYQIVAEIREPRNVELARIVGGSEVQVVLADELISRILVQSTRQTGLSAVFAELLGFEGSEIYTAKVAGIAGMTFGDALGVFEAGALIGLCDDAAVRLNPAMDTVIGERDDVVVIALDANKIRARPAARPDVDLAAICQQVTITPAAKRILMLGWNRRGTTIANELARFVSPGSGLMIVADSSRFDAEAGKLEGAYANLAVQRQEMDTTREATLRALDVSTYDHIIVLAQTDDLAIQSADTRTLVTLLQLRKLIEATGRHVNVVSEMVDARNRALAEVTRADDFVVSNQLVSLMLAQASENKHLSAIFAELLDEEGSEVYVRPVSDYVSIDRPLNFYTLMEAARRRGEVAFGHRIATSGRGERNMGGVVVNPDKKAMRTYLPTDALVVLARE